MTTTHSSNTEQHEAADGETTPRRRRPFRLRIRVAAGLVALVTVLAGTGATYQAVASSLDGRSHPAPGTLVDIGDRRLHLWCSGSGSPTVVLESGLGGFSFDWAHIRADVAESTRVCAYDRSGYGWSDSVDAPLTSTQIARDLHAVLGGGGESGPYVLVGHSAGGIHVRSFARLYPDEVTGMVLVDSAHDNQGRRLEMLAALDEIQRSQLEMCRLLSPLGLMRVLGVHDGALPEDITMSAESRDAWLSRVYQSRFCDTVLGELEMILVETGQTDPPSTLGDLPLIVLTRGQSLSFDDVPIDGVTQETLDEATRVGMELQAELAALSSNGVQRVVDDSGHYIHWEQPASVVEAILEIADR